MVVVDRKPAAGRMEVVPEEDTVVLGHMLCFVSIQVIEDHRTSAMWLTVVVGEHTAADRTAVVVNVVEELHIAWL